MADRGLRIADCGSRIADRGSRHRIDRSTRVRTVEGKIALVTGGTSGIGKAVAALLARRGARVVIAARNEIRGEAVARDLVAEAGDVTFLAANVGREREVEALVARTIALLGGLDERSLDLALEVNVKGVFLGMKHAIRYMAQRGGGAIVNVSSFVGTVMPLPNAVVYGATKAAVLSITRSMAAAAARHGVRIYALCPWMTETPMVDRLTGGDAGLHAASARLNPSGRMAMPEEIAHIVYRMLIGTAGVESGDALLVDAGGASQRVQPLAMLDAVNLSV
jgi:NAD(P)-dependent dehydrogenase (short-subunit alcohol dehydrogenase family)